MKHASEESPASPVGGRRLILSRPLFERIVAHACSVFPHECCGVLIGRNQDAGAICDRVIPGKNIASGDLRKRYQLDWQTLLDSVKGTRNGDAVILGFYHSHPQGSARPSERDRDEAWPDTTYLIVSVHADGGKPRVTQVRGWRVVEAGGPFAAECLALV